MLGIKLHYKPVAREQIIRIRDRVSRDYGDLQESLGKLGVEMQQRTINRRQNAPEGGRTAPLLPETIKAKRAKGSATPLLPRVLTGTGRDSIRWRRAGKKGVSIGPTALSKKGFPYMLAQNKHRPFQRIRDDYRPKMRRAIKKWLETQLKKGRTRG